jgi:hypothetical protein
MRVLTRVLDPVHLDQLFGLISAEHYTSMNDGGTNQVLGGIRSLHCAGKKLATPGSFNAAQSQECFLVSASSPGKTGQSDTASVLSRFGSIT